MPRATTAREPGQPEQDTRGQAQTALSISAAVLPNRIRRPVPISRWSRMKS
jgi:hypothetical protein